MSSSASSTSTASSTFSFGFNADCNLDLNFNMFDTEQDDLLGPNDESEYGSNKRKFQQRNPQERGDYKNSLFWNNYVKNDGGTFNDPNHKNGSTNISGNN